MKLRDKFKKWVVEKDVFGVQARYEAAFRSAARTYVPANIQGAREDINTMSRQEILRLVRYFEKNNPVLQKALAILDVNVIGSGINPTPCSSNVAHNEAALKWWNDWVNTADITGLSTIYDMQGIAFRGQNVDGDHAIELTENEFGRPALNMIEAHRIGSGAINQKQLVAAGYQVVDGVIIGPNGKPLAYTVQNEFDGKTVATIEASNLVFFFKRKRAGQYRGISRFHGAIKDLHDLDDLQMFEMKGAKDGATISKFIKLAAGGLTQGGEGIGGSLRALPAAPTTAQQQGYYRQTLGGETLVLNPGDDVAQFKNDRPSAATSGFWLVLENKFVQGSGLSFAAIRDYQGNWGGATLRAAVTSDNRLFCLETNEQARRWQKIYEYGISWAMAHGEVPPEADFRNVRWHPPRRPTVDIGNESAATINELRTGLKTFETIYGEAGDDWRDRLEQRAIEEKFISDLADKYGIDRTLISSFAQERVTLTALGTPQEVTGDPGMSAPAASQPSTSPTDKNKAKP